MRECGEINISVTIGNGRREIKEKGKELKLLAF